MRTSMIPFLIFSVMSLLSHEIYGLKPFRLNNQKFSTNRLHPKKLKSEMVLNSISTSNLLKYRGGVATKHIKKKDDSPGKQLLNKVNELHPATRFHFILAIFCTLVHILGFPAPDLFSLDRSRVLQLWRPFTSMSYLGPPSLSFANNLYFLVKYGQSLEAQHGTATHIWFLLVETAVLTTVGLLLSFPFQARSLISAAIYTSCNINPTQKMQFQFGLKIESWQLPFLLMTIDCLSHQSLGAAWPHAIGIFGGHVFHFFREVWPSLGGKRFLDTPQWMTKTFKGPLNAVNGEVDYRGHVTDYRTTSYSDIKSASKQKDLLKASATLRKSSASLDGGKRKALAKKRRVPLGSTLQKIRKKPTIQLGQLQIAVDFGHESDRILLNTLEEGAYAFLVDGYANVCKSAECSRFRNYNPLDDLFLDVCVVRGTRLF